MNNEPIAWWTGEFNDEADDFMFDSTKQKHVNHVNSRTHEFFPIPLYTRPVKEHFEDEPQAEELHEILQSNNHPVKELFKDAENRDELIGQEFETYLEKLTQDFKEGFKEGVLFCEDVARRPALYGQDTHPVEEPAICVGHWDYKTGAFHKHLTESQQKRVDEGFLQPVYTAGMLPVKELTDEEIGKFKGEWYRGDYASFYDLVRAILKKAQEK